MPEYEPWGRPIWESFKTEAARPSRADRRTEGSGCRRAPHVGGGARSFGAEAAPAVPALRKAAVDKDPDVAREAGVTLVKLQPGR